MAGSCLSRARLEERSRTAPSVGAPLGLYRERARTTGRLLENMSSTGVWCFKGATRLLVWKGDQHAVMYIGGSAQGETPPCATSEIHHGTHQDAPSNSSEPLGWSSLFPPSTGAIQPLVDSTLTPTLTPTLHAPAGGGLPIALCWRQRNGTLQANNVHTVSRDKPKTETGGINRDKTRYRTVPGARFCAGWMWTWTWRGLPYQDPTKRMSRPVRHKISIPSIHGSRPWMLGY